MAEAWAGGWPLVVTSEGSYRSPYGPQLVKVGAPPFLAFCLSCGHLSLSFVRGRYGLQEQDIAEQMETKLLSQHIMDSGVVDHENLDCDWHDFEGVWRGMVSHSPSGRIGIDYVVERLEEINN